MSAYKNSSWVAVMFVVENRSRTRPLKASREGEAMGRCTDAPPRQTPPLDDVPTAVGEPFVAGSLWGETAPGAP
jgi:hypothetical protein